MEKQEILFIGLVWPEPSSSAAGFRIIQLLKSFQNNGNTITFASAASRSPYSADLSAMGIHEVEIKLNDASFNDFVQELNPNIVVFDRFMTEEQYSWRVAQECPDAVRILDTEDLHFYDMLANLIPKAESNLIKPCSILILPSARSRQFYVQTFPSLFPNLKCSY
ncbi:hypothetical protein OKW96_01845 [Sphingobacterium sp. KU25419]|nr:hypothetical protein OKW96_01845 [Sphingobacterium sp. KU25419]